MNLHNLLSSLIVFFALAAFGALVFALAHFASHGAFSPTVMDDAAPEQNSTNGESAAVQRHLESQDLRDAL